MKKLIYDTINEKLLPWPRIDDAPVVDLDPALLEMELIEEEEPDYDFETEQLQATEVINVEEETVVRGWEVIPIPAPTSVPKHKFLGQLALEVIQGQNEQLKQQLLALGNPEDLLVELVKASDALPANQIPLAIVEIKLTDNIKMAHPFVTALAPVFGYDTQEKIDDFGRRAIKYRFGGD